MKPELVRAADAKSTGALADAVREVAVAGRSTMYAPVLFRGFDVFSPADLEFVIQRSGLASRDYRGGNSPRKRIGANVFTASEFSPTSVITSHQELSFEVNYPDLLLFLCDHPSSVGGETTLTDASDVLSELPTATVNRFKSRGVRYVQRLGSRGGLGRSWQESYETESPKAVSEILKAADLEYSWDDNMVLTIVRERPAVIKHLGTGKEVWFNQAEQWHESNAGDAATRKRLTEMFQSPLPHEARFGDGGLIAESEILRIRAVCAGLSFAHRWSPGDLLLIDNETTMHGRLPYRGERRIAVAMTTRRTG